MTIRLRVTLLVALGLAAIAIVGSLVFLRWFEAQLEDDVRAQDREEIRRQIEFIEALDELVDQQPGLLVPSEILEDVPEDTFPVALIPDDGTQITLTNRNGDLVGSTEISAQVMRASSTGSADDPSLAVVEEGLLAGEGFLDALARDLSEETRVEFAEALLLVDLLFTDVSGLEEGDVTNDAEISDLISRMFFDTDIAAGEGREVVTTETTSIVGEPITVTAVSRVTTIDAALDDVRQTLIVTVPLLVLLVGAATYLATGRALRPVGQITNRVDEITSAGSGDRVPEPDTGDEIQHLASTMNGMLARLEAGASSQRRFVSDVSHELRTPAAVIRAEIEAGLADPENDWAKTGESVLAEQQRLSALVDDLLLLAKVDEGGTPRRAEVDLDELVQTEAARGWAHPVATHHVQPVRVIADERQLQRVVQNLLANAERHADAQVAVAVRRDGDRAVLWVDDDGAGVPVGERERVFERFARRDESRERDHGGSGLGLAIVREVARAHGGEATITNSPLGGARVQVEIAVS